MGVKASLWLRELISNPRARLTVLLGSISGTSFLFWKHILDGYTPSKLFIDIYTGFIVSIDSGIEIVVLQKFASPIANYFFTYFYLFASFIPVLTLALFISRRGWNDAIRICLCSLLAYILAFIMPYLFPVAPPRFAVSGVLSIRNEVLPQSEGLIPSGFLYAAFPSLHMIGATYSLLCANSFKMRRAYFYLWGALLFLTAFSTLFLGEHYLVDVFAGLVVGAALWMVAGALQRVLRW